LTTYLLEYHPAAESEIYSAAKWYKARSPTAALRFAAELNARIQLILDDPERWPMFEANSRRILLRRFPFSIIYRLKGDVVSVLAVMHHRREPGYWMHR
jgi:plasmid stabilization system protein ParE